MPAIPKFAKKASITLQLPKLGTPPRYTSFLSNLFAIRTNKKVIAVLQKSDVDAHYSELLQERFQHDDQSIRDHMTEANAKSGREKWGQIQRDSRKGQGGASPGGTASVVLSPTVTEAVKQLRLAVVGAHPKNSKYDMWDLQKYGDFAKKTERMNAGTAFTKEQMDNAFRVAVAKVEHKRVKGSTSAEINKMLGRVGDVPAGYVVRHVAATASIVSWAGI